MVWGGEYFSEKVARRRGRGGGKGGRRERELTLRLCCGEQSAVGSMSEAPILERVSDMVTAKGRRARKERWRAGADGYSRFILTQLQADNATIELHLEDISSPGSLFFYRHPSAHILFVVLMLFSSSNLPNSRESSGSSRTLNASTIFSLSNTDFSRRLHHVI